MRFVCECCHFNQISVYSNIFCFVFLQIGANDGCKLQKSSRSSSYKSLSEVTV